MRKKNVFTIEPFSILANLTNQEKQEIKTVRIVKRESERRNRERSSSTMNSTQNMDHVMEEEAQANDDYNRSKSLPRTYIETHEVYRQHMPLDRKLSEPHTTVHQMQTNGANSYSSSPSIPVKYTDYYNEMTAHSSSMAQQRTNRQHYAPPAPVPVSAYTVHAQSNNPFINYMEPTPSISNGNHGLRHKTESIQSLTKTIGDLSPVFQSEAARQIIIEMSGNTSEENNEKAPPPVNKQRRAVPREKRRHYTAPNTINAKTIQTIQSENDMNKNVSIFQKNNLNNTNDFFLSVVEYKLAST